MRARVRDELTVKGRRESDEDCYGKIARVDGANGALPYLVHWRDGHESVFFPSSDTGVGHHSAQGANNGAR